MEYSCIYLVVYFLIIVVMPTYTCGDFTSEANINTCQVEDHVLMQRPRVLTQSTAIPSSNSPTTVLWNTTLTNTRRAVVPLDAAPRVAKNAAVNTTCTTTEILIERPPVNVTPGSYVVGGGQRGFLDGWGVSFNKGVHFSTPIGGASISSAGFDFQIGPDGFPLAEVGVDFDEGFNIDTKFLSSGFEVGIGDQGFSFGAEVLGQGFDATIGTPPLDLQLDSFVASAGVNVGPDGFDLNGDINVFGLAGASFEAGCGPTCEPCCGEGNAWHNEKCADFFKDLATGGLFQSLRNFRMPQIIMPSVALKKVFEDFKERMQAVIAIAEALPNCDNPMPDKMLECIEKDEGGKTAIETLLTKTCSSLFSGDDVVGVLTSLAMEQLARLKSFGDSCLSQICVGHFCFDKLMAWTKAFTLSLGFGASKLFAAGALEFGVAIEFSDDSAKVTNLGCFVGASSGVSTDPGVDAGISAALWRDYRAIPGHSITVSGEVDLCDLLIPGCPVALEVAGGMISTYLDAKDRQQLISQVQSCLKSTAPRAKITGIPQLNFDGCFGTLKEFLEKTNGIAIPIAPETGVDVNIVPLAFEVMTDYTVLVPIGCDNENVCDKATDVVTLVGSSAALKRDVEIGKMCVGPRVFEVNNGAGQSFCLSKSSDNRLVLGDCNLDDLNHRPSPETQLWTIEANMIRLSGPSQMCVALPNATTAKNGARVVTRLCDGRDPDQKWQSLASGQIRSQLGHLCIDAGIHEKKNAGDDVYVWACVDRSASGPAVIENAKGVGSWGGACTCPNSGEVYWVGDLNEGCDSLACYGGVAGTCHREENGIWSGKRVNCDGYVYNQAIIPHLVQQWSFNLQSLMYSTTFRMDVGPSSDHMKEVACDRCKDCSVISNFFPSQKFKFIESSTFIKVIRYDTVAGWTQNLKIQCHKDVESLCLRAAGFTEGADVNLASCDEQDPMQVWNRGGLLIQPRDRADLCLTAKRVSCGSHYADTCAQCPSGHGAGWCNGQCVWSSDRSECVPNDVLDRPNSLSLTHCTAPQEPGRVWCGGHSADSCSKCPVCGNGWCGIAWCNGDCVWNEPVDNHGKCIPKDRNQLWVISTKNQIFQEDFSNQALAKLGTNQVGFTQSSTTIIVHVGAFDGSKEYKTIPCDHCGGCTILGENIDNHRFHFGYTDSIIAVARIDAVPGTGWHEKLALRCYSESAGQCPFRANSGEDCGFHGITQEECESRGCCWDPTSPTNWCYPKGKAIEAQRFTMKMHCVHPEEISAAILESFVWAKN